jgi:hypothetical protein
MKPTYKIPTDEEIAQIERETAERDALNPCILSARYDAATGALVLGMRGDTTLIHPARSLPSLENATDAELTDVRPMARGTSLHFPSLDVQFSTIALLRLIFNIRTIDEVTRKGGLTKSPARARASAENGKKGGRPRKLPAAA